MSTIGTPRRYYLAKRQAAAAGNAPDLEAVWRSKQEAEAGTALPATFSLLAELATYGYTTAEDLDGADECELTTVGLSPTEAAAVLQAWALLP